MRAAIAAAEVGDDVLDGDPTTRRLESEVARLLGHESALFFPTGTQANQVAIRLLTEPGAEVVVEEGAHLTDLEENAAAALWGVQLRTVKTPDGVMTPELVADRIRKGRYHPRTAAIVVENTHNAAGGKVTDLETMAALRRLADAHDVPLHLDGARLWNAAHALGCPPARLGCPVGACLAGPKALLERGVTIRRQLGGGMRQSGILAAACLYALEHNLPRLGDDHARAELAAGMLAGHAEVTPVPPDTNIVMLDLRTLEADEAERRLAREGVLVSVFGPRRLRFVTHLCVSEEDVRQAATTIDQVLGEGDS
jgi:threonine aldolase